MKQHFIHYSIGTHQIQLSNVFSGIEFGLVLLFIASCLTFVGRDSVCAASPNAETPWMKTAVLKGHKNPVVRLAFSADSRTLVSCDHKSVRVWGLLSGEKIVVAPQSNNRVVSGGRNPSGSYSVVAISPDGQAVATGGLVTYVSVWNGNAKAGEEMSRLDVNGSVHALVFSPDGKQLAAGVDLAKVGNHVQIWDTADWKERITLKGHRGIINETTRGHIGSLAYSEDGHILVSGSWDGSTKVWDTQRAQELQTLEHEHPVVSVDVSRDATTLVSSQCKWVKKSEKDVGYPVACFTKIWDLESGQARITLDEETLVNRVQFSPDGLTLATAGGRSVKLWRVAGGVQISDMKHESMVRWVEYSPDGKTLAAACHDHTIVLWEQQPLQDRKRGSPAPTFRPQQSKQGLKP